MRFYSCFEIDELFGDVLTSYVFVCEIAGEAADLVECAAKLVFRNANDEPDIERAFCGVAAVALFCFGGNDETAVRFGN